MLAKLLAVGSLKFGDSYTCTYCLQVIRWDHHRTRPTKDHFFPKNKKNLLMSAKTEVIMCCQHCNSRKSDKVFCTHLQSHSRGEITIEELQNEANKLFSSQ